MPGKYCNGVPADQPFVKESKAYCQGGAYRLGDTATNRPITDNPYSATGRPVEKAAWDLGWTLVDDNAGGTISKADAGCCGFAGQTVPGP